MDGQPTSTRLIDALNVLSDVAAELTPDEAASQLDEPSLQVFWREWPEVSGWAGALWRALNVDLAEPAKPVQDPDSEEIGGSG